MYQERTKPNMLLDGWKEWWNRVETEAESKRKEMRISKAGQKKKNDQERVKPNILLTGWRTWWSRMESESRRDEKQSGRLEKEKLVNLKGEKQADWLKRYFQPMDRINNKLDKLVKPNSQTNNSVQYVPSTIVGRQHQIEKLVT